MLAHCWHTHIKQLSHRLLRCPNGLILIHHLNPILLTFKHEDEKLCCTISYFYIFCHNLSNYAIVGIFKKGLTMKRNDSFDIHRPK